MESIIDLLRNRSAWDILDGDIDWSNLNPVIQTIEDHLHLDKHCPELGAVSGQELIHSIQNHMTSEGIDESSINPKLLVLLEMKNPVLSR